MTADWQRARVSELQDAGILLVEDGNHGESRPRPNEFGYGSVAFIRAADMDGGRISFETAQRINTVAVARIRKGIGRGGDVLFSHKGTVGKLAAAPLDAPPFVCSPQTTFWRTLKPEELDRKFLYYFMSSSAFSNQWRARKGETDMADYVSLTAQREFWLSRPHAQEQQAIVGVLAPLDEKIELNRQMNRTLEATAQAIFKSWFVDFDPIVARAAGRRPFGMDAATAALFPNRFIESELGPIPEGCTVGSVAALARYVNGRNFTKNASGSGRMVIRIAELNSGPGGSTVYSDSSADPANTAYPGDLLFAWSGSLDVYRWHLDEALINQHVFKVISDEFPQWFVHFQLREAMPFFQQIAAGKATTMGHIKREHLSQALLAIPAKPLLIAADASIAPLYTLIHENERQSSELAALRDLLLPKLLSGQMQLKDAEKVVEAANP